MGGYLSRDYLFVLVHLHPNNRLRKSRFISSSKGTAVPPHQPSQAEKFTEAIQTKLIARIAMILTPVILGAGWWVTTTYLDGVRSELRKLSDGQETSAKSSIRVEDRLGTVESVVKQLTEQSYRPSDAVRDQALINQKNLEQDRRLDMGDQRLLNVETRVLKLENP